MSRSISGRILFRSVAAPAIVLACTAGLVTVGAGAAAAGPPRCTAAGTSGFTAAVVATAGQRIARRRVDATGCDVGIYIGPGTTHVTVAGVSVSGASDAGILAQDTSQLTITGSTVHGNGFDAPPSGPIGAPPSAGDLPQAFGISLFGVSDSRIERNVVFDNGRGGIGVMDDGPFDPGQVIGGTGTTPTANVPADRDVVAGNILWANYAGCAIVIAAFNTGEQMGHDTVTGNVVIGTTNPQRGTGFGPHGAPDVGGIVVQTNAVHSTISEIEFAHNIVANSAEAGIIVHAAAPGSTTMDVAVTGNMLSGNNWAMGVPANTAGVVVDSRLNPQDLGQRTVDTVVTRNIITGEFYGVWSRGPDAPVTSRNHIRVTAGGTPVYRQPAG
ncbi:MAG: right-handed parallel beta-helix repeat-containing protein [Actinobacteria bacterium]|nr:right-handed parallel beta-helix repeat-containing protein [Actinomycetota bacterium]